MERFLIIWKFDSMPLMNWVDQPGSCPGVDDFEQLGRGHSVWEGSQVTFLPIPTVAGDRLAGYLRRTLGRS